MRSGKTASFHALGKNQILECLNLLRVLNAKFSVNALLVRAKQHDKAHSGVTRGAAAGVTSAAAVGVFFYYAQRGIFWHFFANGQSKKQTSAAWLRACCCDAVGARAAGMAFIHTYEITSSNTLPASAHDNESNFQFGCRSSTCACCTEWHIRGTSLLDD